MKLLALDTAMAACSVAVHESGQAQALAKALVPMERGHAEAIAPMTRDVMDRAGLAFSSLGCIAVTVGPGTFTGVRIGLAMARGLGVALGIPVKGIDTLSAIAANEIAGEGSVLVAADARKDEVYAALFDERGRIVQAPAVMSIDACLRLLPGTPVKVLGSAAGMVIAGSQRNDLIRSRAGDIPDAAVFGALGFDLPVSDVMPAPLYLRSPDAKPQEVQHRAPLPLSFQSGDPPHLAALHAECFDNPWTAADFAKLLDMPGARSMLAMEGGDPVGFILLRTAADEAEIITVGTRPFAQRRGVAKALLYRQFAELGAGGVSACFIEVAGSNTAGRALYASCGFAEAGTRRGYYERAGSAREDAIVMRRELSP